MPKSPTNELPEPSNFGAVKIAISSTSPAFINALPKVGPASTNTFTTSRLLSSAANAFRSRDLW